MRERKVKGSDQKVRDEVTKAVGKTNYLEVTDQDLRSLKRLDLSYLGITELKENYFDGLSSLEELILDGNEVKNPSVDGFSRSLFCLKGFFFRSSSLRIIS